MFEDGWSRSKRAVLAVTSAIVLIVSGPSLAAPKPSSGKPCKTSQIGTVIGSLVCAKSGKSAVWRKSAPSSSLAATTTTALDITKAPPGTVLYSENFDDPAKSTWAKQSLGGYTGDVVDGQFRMAAAPPRPAASPVAHSSATGRELRLPLI